MLGCRMDMRADRARRAWKTVDPVITGQESFTQLSPENPPLSTDRVGYFVVQEVREYAPLNRVWNS